MDIPEETIGEIARQLYAQRRYLPMSRNLCALIVHSTHPHAIERLVTQTTNNDDRSASWIVTILY